MINVSIPQAVWIACNDLPAPEESTVFMFQYRKRYGLHAMQKLRKPRKEVALFQYRKRYGLHAIMVTSTLRSRRSSCFNTASGMDCMQSSFF